MTAIGSQRKEETLFIVLLPALTVNGYAVIRSITSRPYEGDVLYGDFSYDGIKDIYNRSAGIIITGDLKEHWLTYSGAQDALDYYCY